MLNFSDFFAGYLVAVKSFPNFARRKSGGMHPANDEALLKQGPTNTKHLHTSHKRTDGIQADVSERKKTKVKRFVRPF